MSTVFKIYCALHETEGPMINRGAGSTWLASSDFTPHPSGGGEWPSFLIEHESCPLVLYNERSAARAQVQAVADMADG